jgi:TonB family protein
VADPAKPNSGGNLKYILGGLFLLGGALLLFMFLRPSQTRAPAPESVPTPPVSPERVNPMAEPELILDEQKEEEPEEQAAAEDDKPKRVVREVRDEWDCAGDLAKPALQSVIDNNRAQIRSCYERRLKMNNVLQGDLKLKIKVAPSGHVGAAAVSGSLKDNEVFSCVRSIAQKWSFPPPENGCAVVQIPFQFSPKQ